MARLGCLVALAISASLPGGTRLSAQESLVVQAGAGFGGLWDTPEDLPGESRVSARAEAALIWPVSPSFGLQIGVGYARETGRETAFDLEYTLTVDFVQVPVLARFRFGGPEARFSPHAVVGPTLAVAASCEIRQDTTAPGASQPEILDCDDDGGVLELGALAALGLDTRLAERTWLTLDLVHARVLTPIDARRLKSWSLLAGVRWRLG